MSKEEQQGDAGENLSPGPESWVTSSTVPLVLVSKWGKWPLSPHQWVLRGSHSDSHLQEVLQAQGNRHESPEGAQCPLTTRTASPPPTFPVTCLKKKWSILNCFLFCFVGGGGLVPQLTSSVVWLGCRQKREKVVRCPANSHTTYLSSAEAEP